MLFTQKRFFRIVSLELFERLLRLMEPIREFEEIVYRFGKGSCLVCFAIFGRFLGFGGKRFSRENMCPKGRNLRDFCESGKIGEKWGKGAKLLSP